MPYKPTTPRVFDGRDKDRFLSRVLQTESCWIWQGGHRGSGGYGVWSLGHKGTEYAHRKAWKIWFGPIPDGLFVCHRCDNPPCVRPDHLFLGTPKENTADMIQKGRGYWPGAKGVRNTKAKLSEQDVLLIRGERAKGRTLQSIADQFGVTKPMVGRIARRIAWKHVE